MVAFIATISFAVGCLQTGEEITIPPLSAAGERVDPGLGPEAQPLSFGPGYKGSPSWSLRGNRIAFTVDGYVVDSPVGAGESRRWTTRDFVAEDVEWTSESSLAIFGAAGGESRSVYRASSRAGSLGVEEAIPKALAMSPGPGGEGLLVGLRTGPGESGLALLSDGGALERVYTGDIAGRVAGLSLSPDARKAVLSVRGPGDPTPSELHVFDLRGGQHHRIARLKEGLEIIGAPQWTREGICYIVGKEATQQGGGAQPLYGLYSIDPDSGDTEPTPGVGKDFVAASIRVSPGGDSLAVIGRLDSSAPINLYVLDMAAQELDDLTVNEDMEIKTGPDDLAWSPDGESVAIVARGAPSPEPRVRAAPKSALLEDFYNLYAVPVAEQGAMR